jgi:hypothetical protein
MPFASRHFHSTKTAVFIGPSSQAVSLHTECTFFPPASAGDLDFAVENGYSTIIFADALFFDAAPTHREIMRALSRHVRVIGVSSAGALRAVELRRQGMDGFGIIFELYRRGLVTDDGELASVLNSETYTAATPPLIQVRYYLGYLHSQGVRLEILRAIYHRLAECYFMGRDLTFIDRILKGYLSQETYEALFDVSSPIFNLKSIDFKNLMTHLFGGQQGKSIYEGINVTWVRTGLKL